LQYWFGRGVAQGMPQCTARIALALTGLWVLGCGGLDFSAPELTDVTAATAIEDGYRVPIDATHVHVKDFSPFDVRTTWFRFQVPRETFDNLQAEYGDDSRYTRVDEWVIPSHWPDFSTFKEEGTPPTWWSPKGSPAFQKEVPSEGMQGNDMGYGSQIVFDQDTLTIHQWQWEWQWWGST
jgi:hypothetical protein